MSDIQKRVKNNIFKVLVIATAIFYIPILALSWFAGDKIDYYFPAKETFLLPNFALFMLVIPGIAIVLGILKIFSYVDKKPFSKQVKVGMPILLAIYIILFFVNRYIAMCVAYGQGWDVGVVTQAAYGVSAGQGLEPNSYFIVYPNNIPIAYILAEIYRKVPGSYKYYAEFMWLAVNCMLISVSGFAMSFFVMLRTKKSSITFIATALYVALWILLPHKIVPYTDTYSLCFPILIICLYGIYSVLREKTKKTFSYFIWVLLIVITAIGSTIKVTVLVSFIAVVMAECIRIILEDEKKTLKISLLAIVASVTLLSKSLLLSGIEEKVGFERMPEYEVGWQHYFYMGLMDGSDGAYNGESLAILFANVDRPVSERHSEELKAALDVIKNRSFGANIYHCVKKMLMTFNDGTFTWWGEGSYQASFYPEITESRFKTLLRTLFWHEGKNYYFLATLCQYIWFVILVGVPGYLMQVFRKKDWVSFAVLLTLFGLYMFIFLFEARARYLITYIPLYIVAGTIGINEYYMAFKSLKARNKKETIKDAKEKHL